MFKQSGSLRRAAFVVAVLAGVTPAFAGLPSDVVLKADEQDGDQVIGLTVAKGNAELSAAVRKIKGRADVIEVWGKRNQVYFKGGAHVTVGSDVFESETVVCALDFYTCKAMDSSGDKTAAGTAAIIPQ